MGYLKHCTALGVYLAAGCSSGGDAPAATTPTGTPGMPPLETPSQEGTPFAAGMKRLRTFEYQNSIRDLLGADIRFETALRPDLVRANFSSISACLDCYEAVGLEARESIALAAASQAFSRATTPLSEAGCSPDAATDPCVRQFIASFGERVFRRPLSGAELDKYDALALQLSGIYDGDANKGVELTVAALLQSPYFLYRVELGQPSATDPQSRAYTPHEMAGRLSYSLWETTPDAELMRAAGAGELVSQASVRAHAQRMLQDPRAESALSRFWVEHLNVERLTLTNYPRSSQAFPGFEPSLYDSMRQEGRHLAQSLVQPGADAMSFLSKSTAFVDGALAEHYGMEPPADGFQELPLPPGRVGYLTSGLFLSTMAHPGKTSPSRRGKFALERVLCVTIAPPPPDVDVSLPDIPSGQATLREQLEAHRSEPACAGCHAQIDPIGFALEGFDALGAARELDNGLPVDASGTLAGQSFTDAQGMIDVLRGSTDTVRCVVQQAMRHQVGLIEDSAQQPYISALAEAFAASGHDFRTLIADMVSSDVFRFARGTIGDAAVAAADGAEYPSGSE